MTKETFPAATLKPNEERRIQRGHLWVYRNEFATLPELADGAVFDIFSASRRFVGRGFYQATGGIASRILSRRQEPIDREFFLKRLETAQRLRRMLFPDSSVYRWVYGESDFLPGLVVDRYGSVAVAHSSCAFYQLHQDLLAEILLHFDRMLALQISGMSTSSCYGEPMSSHELDLDGIRIQLSFSGVQKTGLFLDQRENWPLIRRFAKNATVLDGYCYHGLWGIHAALGGASSVLCVDTSGPALDQARLNAEHNGVSDQCTFEKDSVENILERGSLYDLIVLDPPAFAKTRGQSRKAMGLYEEMNFKAMNALAKEGILVSCSCSHFMPRDDFLEAIKRAARRASRQVQILSVRGASPDHPVSPMMPETDYLKCVLMRVL